jgi:hypothetical protein
MKVKVKTIPVRYNGKTYQPEETFEMAEKYVNEEIVEKLPSSSKKGDEE